MCVLTLYGSFLEASLTCCSRGWIIASPVGRWTLRHLEMFLAAEPVGHTGRNVTFPLPELESWKWEKVGRWDVLLSLLLNDSPLAALQLFHIGASLLNSGPDRFLAFLGRLSVSSTARFHCRLSNIASLSLSSPAQNLLRPLMLNSSADRRGSRPPVS